MPSGYTASIHEGEDVTAEDFILKCARAFGGLSHMRDDSLSDPIRRPAQPKSSDDVEKSADELEKALALTLEEAEQIIAQRRKEGIVHYDKRLKEAKELEIRYRKVLDEVLKWKPPTEEHQTLKDFSVEQLESSIKHDCTPYGTDPRELPIDTPEEFIADEIKHAIRRLSYNIRYEKEKKERLDGHAKWIDDLLGSFDSISVS